ncbi:hypothetical protein AB0I27_22575 [Streptomyces sp. NPDC050597]|uniref:hypothetical protein n=1 Tax=Streptomyces sp. NPDC050597 TaxID=3157212 RepID=UPI003421AA30
MPLWLIQYPAGQGRDDYRIDDDLTLTFSGDWAIFNDHHGPTYAVPAGLGIVIERIDEQQDSTDQEPEPHKE